MMDTPMAKRVVKSNTLVILHQWCCFRFSTTIFRQTWLSWCQKDKQVLSEEVFHNILEFWRPISFVWFAFRCVTSVGCFSLGPMGLTATSTNDEDHRFLAHNSSFFRITSEPQSAQQWANEKLPDASLTRVDMAVSNWLSCASTKSFELRKAKQLILVDPDSDPIRIKGAQTEVWKLTLRTNPVSFSNSRNYAPCPAARFWIKPATYASWSSSETMSKWGTWRNRLSQQMLSFSGIDFSCCEFNEEATSRLLQYT